MNEPRIDERLRERVRARAGDRCGYCLSPQRLVWGWLEVEHILPKAKGGTDEETNLWLACRLCNGYKRTQIHGRDPQSGKVVRLFNPRRQRWLDHFMWDRIGTRILGRTACGRATVRALKLNNPIAVRVRREWITAGWQPPWWD